MSLEEAARRLAAEVMYEPWYQGVGVGAGRLCLYTKTRSGKRLARRRYGESYEGYPLTVRHIGPLRLCRA
jgi:hypothetical protein